MALVHAAHHLNCDGHVLHGAAYVSYDSSNITRSLDVWPLAQVPMRRGQNISALMKRGVVFGQESLPGMVTEKHAGISCISRQSAMCVCAIHMHAAGFCAQVKLKFSEPALGVFACNADACSSGSGCKTAHGPPDPQGSMFLKAMLCGGQVITICTLM